MFVCPGETLVVRFVYRSVCSTSVGSRWPRVEATCFDMSSEDNVPGECHGRWEPSRVLLYAVGQIGCPYSRNSGDGMRCRMKGRPMQGL